MKPPRMTSVIGIDPGPTTGICFLDYAEAENQIYGRTILQVDGASAQLVLEAMLVKWYSYEHGNIVARFAGVENFITGRSAGTRGDSADVTRQLVMKFAEQLQMWGYVTKIRKAADVKPWASDKRLKAAGILGPPEMRHANDGARHALITAREAAHMPDPLR